MKEMKIFLQYPWKYPDSPYYKYLIENSPKDVEYLNVKNQKGVLTSSRKLFLSHNAKRAVRMVIGLLKIPILNVHLTKSKKNFDLIHCAHCLSWNKNKPWVADFEGLWQIYFENKSLALNKKLKKIMLRKSCKKILPWTEKVKEMIALEFPDVKNKLEVVYPAIPLPNVKNKKHEGINLLFVGRYFFRKGGLHALEAMDRLTKKYENVSGIIVSDTPQSLIKKYSKNKRLKFYELMPQEKLFEEIYSKADIFVYPGYRDSFGFSFLEAMSFGIPAVTVNGFARNEIIDEGKTGFIIDEKMPKPEMMKYNENVIQKIQESTEKLIKNKKLRERMSKNCINLIKKGKFSIKERNKKLAKIYKESLT